MKTQAGVPQGSMLSPILYILYTADIPIRDNTFTALFADDTAEAKWNKNYNRVVEKLHFSLDNISNWARRWKIAINEAKSIWVDFTLRRYVYQPSVLDGKLVPQANAARYLGLHLDSKLNWAEHIWQKRDLLNLKLRNYSWLIGRRSTPSVEFVRTPVLELRFSKSQS